MIGAIEKRNHSNRNTTTMGVLLMACGPAMDYLFERHTFLKVWENSIYPISWADLFYPPLCVFLFLTGFVLAVGGMTRHSTSRQLRPYIFAIAIPSTVLYTLFTFAMQFVATGADRLDDFPGLDQAA